ncbi:putative membrane protein [Bacillus cereus]|nr:putative membrane protein [Bacillus cereus]AJI05472.1 putative membrane protein [Bacillus cereus G9241]EAL14009.1 hypothetical protein protein [Bacillus cereus G9241]
MQHVKATIEKIFPNLFFINFIPAAVPTIYVIIPNEFGINTILSILIYKTKLINKPIIAIKPTTFTAFVGVSLFSSICAK